VKSVSLTKIDVIFNCPDCGEGKTLNITTAVATGEPKCPVCGTIMDMVECEIDTLE
jgi:transcription elongation factor Elf1